MWGDGLVGWAGLVGWGCGVVGWWGGTAWLGGGPGDAIEILGRNLAYDQRSNSDWGLERIRLNVQN